MADDSKWVKVPDTTYLMWERNYACIDKGTPRHMQRSAAVTLFPSGECQYILFVNCSHVRSDYAKTPEEAMRKCDSFAGRLAEIWND